jgi:hypothetical protein
MRAMKSFFMFYIDGFRGMRVGKTLWKLILIKLVVILVFLKYFVHDTNFNTLYKTKEEKVNFVYTNITGGK